MKSHYCQEEKTVIEYEGECNWCGEKEITKEKALGLCLRVLRPIAENMVYETRWLQDAIDAAEEAIMEKNK